jgi:hypothetical protein
MSFPSLAVALLIPTWASDNSRAAMEKAVAKKKKEKLQPITFW